MKHVVAKFILQLLLPEQREYYDAVDNDLIQTTNNGPNFLKKIINGDAWWVYIDGYDPEMKAKSSQRKSPGSLH